MKRAIIALALLAFIVGAAFVVLVMSRMSDSPLASALPSFVAFSPDQVKRGEYLARVGNCAGCHTARGGAAYAGGLGIPTPFGTVYATNLTPHKTAGIGTWTAADFWNAMHEGKSKDGRLLYPAFPYPNYTHVTRADSDAIFAYLQTVPAAELANRAHELSFPSDQQAALAGWRALYFKPGEPQTDSTKSKEWNRGAYLVRGLGHCGACHSERNVLGATSKATEMKGGMIPMQNWYAPALTDAREAGVNEWDIQHIVALLKTGISARGQASGPMAEVVFYSLQYLTDEDARAIGLYLQDINPSLGPRITIPVAPPPPEVAKKGEELYGNHCATCHGKAGEGVASAYPALVGNRAVTMHSPANLIQTVLKGGFPPATAGNPRPYGMPPFATVLKDEEVAAVLTYIRSAWGNRAAEVPGLTVSQAR